MPDARFGIESLSYLSVPSPNCESRNLTVTQRHVIFCLLLSSVILRYILIVQQIVVPLLLRLPSAYRYECGFSAMLLLKTKRLNVLEDLNIQSYAWPALTFQNFQTVVQCNEVLLWAAMGV